MFHIELRDVNLTWSRIVTLAFIVIIWLYAGRAESAQPCGAPAIDAGAEEAIFLWQDCDTQIWQTRFTAGGGKSVYEGGVSSSEAFTSVSGVSVESNDTLDWMTNPGQIDFIFTIYGQWFD
jgi:hypothetical protein